MNKHVLVTGGNSGIGLGIALGFARAGAKVTITARTPSRIDSAIGQAAEQGLTLRGLTCNVSHAEEVKACVAEAAQQWGGLDIVCCNAGIFPSAPLADMSEQQWDMVINVNLKSAFNFIHACTPIMMRQKAGSIINMASVVGVHGNAGQANYAASKAGMIALAKSIAQELGSRGIRANAIAPGFILTDMTAALSDEVRAEWAKKIPLRRGGTPEDVANIATFLASDMSSYVSGQVIQVDGGMNM